MTTEWTAGMDVITCIPYPPPIISRGIWLADNPFRFSTPVFMSQIAISAFLTGTIDIFLRPFGMCSFFSHMVGAIILGPRMLGSFVGEFIFSHQSLYMLETFQSIVCMFFLFLVGLKMDFRMVTGSGRKAIFIGISVGFFPILVTYPTAYVLNYFYHHTEEKASLSLCAAAVMEAQTSFHVVACLLADLKILNSEIGRLAVASSMISNACSWSTMMSLVALTESKRDGHFNGHGLIMIGSILSLIFVIIHILKPIMHWMVKQIPQGSKNVKEMHVFVVFLMVLLCAYWGLLMGHPPGIGPLVLGLAVPPGPPLAETIEDRLESIVSSVFLPVFYVACSAKMAKGGLDQPLNVVLVMFIIVLAFLTKIIVTVIPSICSGVSPIDSLILGLIIASQGLVNLMQFSGSLDYNHISQGVYTILVYFSVGIAGVTSFLVKMLYNPSRNYLACCKRPLGDSKKTTAEFRILACVYQDLNVPSIIDLLGASTGTDKSTISLYLLHLIELQRIAPPFLIAHENDDDHSIYYNRSKHIINAFRSFEKQCKRRISLKSFSAMSPCATMHQDICSLAVDKQASLIILPFHRQINLDGIMEDSATIRNVNSHVLKVSPCSVGILIDRCHMSATSLIARAKSFFHVALIFLGGPDDREVLTYGMRMVEDPNTTLTVIKFTASSDMNNVRDDKNMDTKSLNDFRLREDKNLDAKLLDDFRRKYIGKDGINYREEVVSDCLGILKAMREIKDTFDLIMVGKHNKQSKLFNGLSEWNENPELGFMGDMLATSNLQEDSPILVLQKKFQTIDDSNFVIQL